MPLIHWQVDCLFLEWNGFSVFSLPCWNGGKRMVKYHQRMRESAFEKKDKDGIRIAQDGIFEWAAFLRFLQGLVHHFFNEEEKVEPQLSSEDDTWIQTFLNAVILSIGKSYIMLETEILQCQALLMRIGCLAISKHVRMLWLVLGLGGMKLMPTTTMRWSIITRTLLSRWRWVDLSAFCSFWWFFLYACLHWIYFNYEGAGMASTDLHSGRSYAPYLLLESLQLLFSASIRMFGRHLWVCSATTEALRLQCSFLYLFNLSSPGLVFALLEFGLLTLLSRFLEGYSFGMMSWVSVSRDFCRFT